MNSSETTLDAVVAQDGSGQFRTIGEALKLVKKKSEKRFVVHVKEGRYLENIDLDKNTWNVFIFGDGKDKTVVVGSRNFMDGTPTFETATFGNQFTYNFSLIYLFIAFFLSIAIFLIVFENWWII